MFWSLDPNSDPLCGSKMFDLIYVTNVVPDRVRACSRRCANLQDETPTTTSSCLLVLLQHIAALCPHVSTALNPAPLFSLVGIYLAQDGGRSWSVLKEDYMMGASSMKVRSVVPRAFI